MKANYIIQVGEPLALSLLAIEGSISNVTSVVASLKLAGPNGSIPPLSQASVATFTVTSAQAPDLGWSLYISDSVTATLKPGFYITNAKLNLAGGAGPIKTDSILIEIKGSVT